MDKAIDIDRKLIKQEYIEWLANMKDWRSFVTLTFKNDTSEFAAILAIRALIRRLNKEVWGDHYVKIVGHSYFSYVYSMEYQIREVVHFHLIVDKPIDYNVLHDFWSQWYGFAWSKKIEIGSQAKVLEYITKYMTKEGTDKLSLYSAKKDYVPKIRPSWWF
ncbi:hypothetical protein EHM76_01635 [bacterium]|nr:MAG: hypothetical protein EHM76_01635 [bacterium]